MNAVVQWKNGHPDTCFCTHCCSRRSYDAKLLNKQVFDERLQELVKVHGSQGKAAEAVGIDPSYFNTLFSGRRKIRPSVEILRRLGLKRVAYIVYERIEQ